ncbi:hypothetical protein AYO40_04460 [Planctomycetaceae bacterium SCGC AG-212-D15]|nr:hypothetical protein AYO40_04460 [Planctomycetaceae bacterium SCGC AG-212-D15]
MTVSATCPAPNSLQESFLKIVPKIEKHAKIHFDDRCPGKREDRIAETIALAWKWFKRMAERGKDATEFPSALASFAVRAVKNGRRVAAMQKTKDVLSERAQRLHGFTVSKLPDIETLESNPLMDALVDNTQTPVHEQANFRQSYPRFLRRQTGRDRRLMQLLAMGNSAKHSGERFGLSPCRVTQIRQRLCREWYAMHDEVAPFERR